MNRSMTLPPESSSRWTGREVLKEAFGKTASSPRNGTVPASGNGYAASVLCGSQLTSEFSSCYHSFQEPSRVCECAFASHWAGARFAAFAEFARIGISRTISGPGLSGFIITVMRTSVGGKTQLCVSRTGMCRPERARLESLNVRASRHKL